VITGEKVTNLLRKAVVVVILVAVFPVVWIIERLDDIQMTELGEWADLSDE